MNLWICKIALADADTKHGRGWKALNKDHFFCEPFTVGPVIFLMMSRDIRPFSDLDSAIVTIYITKI